MFTRAYLGLRRYLLLAAVAFCFICPGARADDWLPVSPDELRMTSEPLAPKAAAIYLYRQIDRDDRLHFEKAYARIKVLTEEGRSQANVAIEFYQNAESIHDIEARIIRPDGSIVKFDGTIYEEPVIQVHTAARMSKKFTLPDVQPGCIIEYRFRRDMSSFLVFGSRWVLSDNLFTKSAQFSLVPGLTGGLLRTEAPVGVPPGTVGPTLEHGVYHLAVQNVPAFVVEEFMPPEDMVKPRVEFVYLRDRTIDKDAETFWQRWAKEMFVGMQKFSDYDQRDIKAAVIQMTSPGDTPDQKLHKLYERVQALRNLAFEHSQSQQEAARDNFRDLHHASDVLNRGFGVSWQINELFIALARAAGVNVDPVMVSTRVRRFFSMDLRDSSQMDAFIGVANLNGRELYFDPATPFTPFGELPWHETGATALRLSSGGGSWVTIPLLPAQSSRLERKAALHLQPDGSLSGRLTVTWTGLEAQGLRLDLRTEDDTGRKRRMEDRLKNDIASGSEVSLVSSPNWTSSDAALTADFDVKIPGWAKAAGTRELVPGGIFNVAGRHLFEHTARVNSVYFRFLSEQVDDITIELPPGAQIATLPNPARSDIRVAAYSWSADRTPSGVRFQRDLTIGTLLVPVKYYDQLRSFFQTVRNSDEAEAVVTLPAVAAAQ
jgi:Domain of Unknown Function with PDB structure (DUF3857)/Transglutaminase-like superfamily